MYDWKNVGFKSDLTEGRCGDFYKFDTSQPGNSNACHADPDYGTGLSQSQKDALVEYLKTL